jgi:hypothetical protein
MYALITDPQYKLPQLAPDGNYCPSVGIEEVISNGQIAFYPNPASKELTITLKKEGSIQIIDLTGSVVFESKFQAEKSVIDISMLASGQYLITGGAGSQKLIVE